MPLERNEFASQLEGLVTGSQHAGAISEATPVEKGEDPLMVERMRFLGRLKRDALALFLSTGENEIGFRRRLRT